MASFSYCPVPTTVLWDLTDRGQTITTSIPYPLSLLIITVYYPSLILRVISIVTLLITLLITTHEPPSILNLYGNLEGTLKYKPLEDPYSNH